MPKAPLLVSLTLAVYAAPAFAQIPATYTSFGRSCGSGAVKPLLTSPKLPVIGREFALTVRNVPSNASGFLVFSGSNRRWQNFNLPLSLASIGATGCDLNVSLDVLLPVTTGSGTAHYSRRLPKDPGLAGVTFFNQYVVTDASANAAGVSFSNGGRGVIGQCLCLQEEAIVENFTDEAQLDKEHSGGAWIGGKAFPAQVGGSGIHGAFILEIGRRINATTYEWSTDRFVIPRVYNETNRDITVTDGVFEFSSMHLPAGYTLKVVGSNPFVLKVRGNARIEGTIDCSGTDAGFFLAMPDPSRPPVARGQAGTAGGPFGGSGGQGGDSCDNLGPAANYNGRNGADIMLPAGHGYRAQAAGTGGVGSPHWPRSGSITNNDYCALNRNFGGDIAAGGGGGGYAIAGGNGTAILGPCTPARPLGTNPNSGGKAFDIVSFPIRSTGPDASLRHFSVGGSGGGGGGSHTFMTRSRNPAWLPGAAGAGGGGLLIARIGRQLVMGKDAVIDVSGGSGFEHDALGLNGPPGDGLFNAPSAGGAGSGGTVLIQTSVNHDLQGLLDCGGGGGGRLNAKGHPQLRADAPGGDGGDGYFRLENPSLPLVSELGRTIPQKGGRNVGKLTDYDLVTTIQTKIYNTGLNFSPHFLRYEIEAELNGRKVLYSDDPNHNSPRFIGPARPGQAVVFRVQGIERDQRTQRELARGPWRDNVRTGQPNSLGEDLANAWRFQLTYDRTMTTSVVVTRVAIVYQR